MSLFRRREERRSISTLPWVQGGGLNNHAISMDRALRLAPVFAAGNLLAGSIAGLPLQAYRKVGDRHAKIPLPPLFAQPATNGTLHDWIYRAVVSLAYRGNAIGLVTSRSGYEYPTSVEWLHPEWVEVVDSNLSGPGSYVNPLWYYRGRPTPAEDLVHIPWFCLPERVWGLSPISAYATTVNTALEAQDYKADWFKSGGIPPGQFKNASQTVDQKAAGVIKERLVQSLRSHEPLVYGSDWEYTPFTVTRDDAQFVETMRLTATQIATIYNIPPEMIGGDTGKSMTYQNVEQQSINFVQFTLLPWLTRLESVFSQLLPENQYVKFNVDGFIRTDIQTRYSVYQIARNIGLMNRDEIRALEDQPPLPNREGQDYTPLEILAANAAHPPAPAPADAPDGVPDAVRQLELVEEGRDQSQLKYGRGSALWKYWTRGEGLAKWIDAEHKWSTLRRLLLEEGVPAHEVDGLTTNIIQAVLPGYMKLAHKKSS